MIAIDELRDWALLNAEDESAGDEFLGNGQQPLAAHFLQVVDALDLLEEALAEATSLSDEIEEALNVKELLLQIGPDAVFGAPEGS